MNRKNLENNKYGKWTVIRYHGLVRVKSGQMKTHWLCKCDCGVTKLVYQHSLTSGKSRSCGCVRFKADFMRSAKNNVLKEYKSKCKRNNIIFQLTDEQFFNLTQQDCYYCGDKPSNVSNGYKHKKQYIYNGLDKVDNNLGYTLDNVVSSCKNCNLAKRLLSKTVFFNMIKKIYERHFNEK